MFVGERAQRHFRAAGQPVCARQDDEELVVVDGRYARPETGRRSPGTSVMTAASTSSLLSIAIPSSGSAETNAGRPGHGRPEPASAPRQDRRGCAGEGGHPQRLRRCGCLPGQIMFGRRYRGEDALRVLEQPPAGRRGLRTGGAADQQGRPDLALRVLICCDTAEVVYSARTLRRSSEPQRRPRGAPPACGRRTRGSLTRPGPSRPGLRSVRGNRRTNRPRPRPSAVMPWCSSATSGWARVRDFQAFSP